MRRLRLVVIEGDGIGPEIVAASLHVLAATGVPVDVEEAQAGQGALAATGSIAPAATVEAVADAGSALKGPTSTPSGGGERSANYHLRHGLQLYGGVRRFVDERRGVDVLLIRENLEDLYGAHEWEAAPGVAQAVKISTEVGARRIALLALRLAEQGGRRLTIVHKANNLKLTEGLFLRTARAAAEEHPSVPCDDMLADSAAGALAGAPETVDALVATNTYGDILSSVAAAVAGGPACVSTVNHGVDDTLLAEAGHGSAPDLAGRGVANPLGMIGATAMLLEDRGFPREGHAIWAAIADARATGAVTPDLGGTATTTEVAESVAACVRSGLAAV